GSSSPITIPTISGLPPGSASCGRRRCGQPRRNGRTPSSPRAAAARVPPNCAAPSPARPRATAMRARSSPTARAINAPARPPGRAAYRRLQEGTVLTIGGREWRVLIGEGHAPEHACLYCAEAGILIAGDQILPKISPNISVQAHEPDGDPLARYLASLQRLR